MHGLSIRDSWMEVSILGPHCHAMLTIVGYSAVVGLAAMFICLPLPGYAAKLIQEVQAARMKKTDSRVQSVSESKSLSILRAVIQLLTPHLLQL
jgi:hypothetical protein